MIWFTVFLCAVFAYFAGAFPFDRAISGAAMSVSRGAHPRMTSFIRVMVNILKGVIVVYLARWTGTPYAAEAAALLVFLGHVFPPQSQFRGGNGMATILGVLIGIEPILALIALFAWLFTYYVYRYACLAAFVATAMTPLSGAALGLDAPLGLLFAMGAVVFWRLRFCPVNLSEGREEMVNWSRTA